MEGITGDQRILIPRKALVELQSLIGNTGETHIVFASDDSNLFFGIGARLLTARRLVGQFPNFDAVLPRNNDKVATVSTDDLTRALLRVAQFADERSNSVRIRLENNELKLSSSSPEFGESEDTITVAYTSEPLSIGFNSLYIRDFLKSIGESERVRLEFKDATSAGELKPLDGLDDYKYRHIVMPMRS